MTRESIYAALFAKFSALTAGGTPLFKTAERKLRHWNDVQPEECPYLGQIQVSETPAQQKGLPPKWQLNVSLYVYVNTAAQLDSAVTPGQLLNPLLDGIEAALVPDDADGTSCTLGGLVSHCRIDGTIETAEGLLGNTEVAIVPLQILVPV